MSIDLHVHTHFSDGTASPEEIVKKAEIIEIKLIKKIILKYKFIW